MLARVGRHLVASVGDEARASLAKIEPVEDGFFKCFVRNARRPQVRCDAARENQVWSAFVAALDGCQVTHWFRRCGIDTIDPDLGKCLEQPTRSSIEVDGDELARSVESAHPPGV